MTAAGLLLLAFALCNFAFGRPLMPAGDVDSSYKMVLNDAFARGLVFGRDVVFTFGPLGFLHATMFDPRTYAWIVLFNVAFAAFVAAGLVAAGRASEASPLRVAVVGLVFLFCALEPDAKFYAFCALVTLLAFRTSPDRTSPLLLAAVALLAVFSLMKFSFLILSAVLLVLIAGARLRRDARGAVLLLGGWAVLVCLAWVAAGQPPAALGDFLRLGFAMAAGYAEAMATPGPAREVGLAVTSAALLVGALAWEEARSAGVRGLVHVAAVAAILAVGLRHGFVRHLSHGVTALYALSAVTVLYAGLAEPGRGRRLGLLGGGAAAAIALAMLVSHHETAAYWRRVRADGRRALARAADVFRGWERSRHDWTAANARVARRHPLPPLEGSVDLLTISQAWVLARGLPLRARPVFQSYQATSPELAALNARFLAERGARNLVWDYQTIDGRYPTLDDGPAWLETIRHYDLARWTGQVAVLERRDAPRPLRLSPLGAVDAGFGERVAVPSTGDPVWARIDLPETFAGRLARMFLRSPQVSIEVALASGETERYRLVPDMARAGFLLSPVVQWPNAFVDFLSPRWRERLAPWRVVSLRLRGSPAARRAFGPDARVEFFALDFRHQGTFDAGRVQDAGRRLDLSALALCNQATVRREGDGLVVEARGTDPFVVLGALAPSTPAEPAYLTLDVEQPHAGMFQVFLRPLGEPFSEDGSARFQLAAGRHRVRVRLPESERLVEVRVDPGIAPGTYRILGAFLAPAAEDVPLEPRPPAEVRGPWFLAAVPGHEPELAYVPAVPLATVGEDAVAPAVGPEALFPAPVPIGDVRIVPAGGSLELVATGRDPGLLLGSVPSSPSGEVRLLRLAVEAFAADILQVYWRRGDERFSERRSRRFPLLPGRHLLQLPVAEGPGPVEFRLDPGTRRGRVVLLGASVSGATTGAALPTAAAPGTRAASAARTSAGSVPADPPRPGRAAR